MKTIFTLLMFVPLLCFAQGKDFKVIPGNELYTVTIHGLNDIYVPDTLVENTVMTYVDYMHTNPVAYEKKLRKIFAIQMFERDRNVVSEYKDGVIYLNWQLNDFPNIKRAAIIHHLSKINGMKTRRSCIPHILSECFAINSWNEEMFRRQFKRHSPYKYAVKQLKVASPLKSKLN